MCMDLLYVDDHTVPNTDFHCIDMPLREPRGDRKLYGPHGMDLNFECQPQATGYIDFFFVVL